VISEWVSPVAMIGVLTLVCGIFLLTWRRASHARTITSRGLAFAFATAFTIVAYSIVDGLGTRAAGSALTYIVLMNLATGVAMLAFGIIRFGGRGLATAADRPTLMTMFAGGAMGVGSYGIALWAMTKAPIALVAAMRETSVLFAALLGILVLREPLVRSRIVAVVLVVAGLGLLRSG
jgi:drug/metabolite transporter (DMT)-like permease